MVQRCRIRSARRRPGRASADRSSAVSSRSPLGSTHPGLPLEDDHPPGDRLEGGDDLGGGGSRADDGHGPARQVQAVVPAGGVERRSSEPVEPGPVGEVRDVEESHRADQDVAFVDLARVEPDGPHVAVVVPPGRAHGGLQAEVRGQPVVGHGFLQVGLELRLAGVGPGPVVGLERVAVEVRVHVDLDPGVRVVPPGPTHAGGRLVDGERGDAGPLQVDAGGDAPEPGTDHHDPRGARGTEEVLRGRVGRPRRPPHRRGDSPATTGRPGVPGVAT